MFYLMLPFFFLVFCNQRLGRNMLMIKVKETLIYCKEFFFVEDYLENKNLWVFCLFFFRENAKKSLILQGFFLKLM